MTPGSYLQPGAQSLEPSLRTEPRRPADLTRPAGTVSCFPPAAAAPPVARESLPHWPSPTQLGGTTPPGIPGPRWPGPSHRHSQWRVALARELAARSSIGHSIPTLGARDRGFPHTCTSGRSVRTVALLAPEPLLEASPAPQEVARPLTLSLGLLPLLGRRAAALASPKPGLPP